MFWSGGLARFEPFTVKALRAAVEPGDTVLRRRGEHRVLLDPALAARRPRRPGRGLRARAGEPRAAAVRTSNATAAGTSRSSPAPSARAGHGDLQPRRGHRRRPATSAATPTAGELAVGTGKVRLIETRVETIDGLCERLGSAPDVIKMDIEGGEIHALAGRVGDAGQAPAGRRLGAGLRGRGARSSGSSTATATGCGTWNRAGRSRPATTRSWSSRSTPSRSDGRAGEADRQCASGLSPGAGRTTSLDARGPIALPCSRRRIRSLAGLHG